MKQKEIDELALEIAKDAIIAFTKIVIIDPGEGLVLKDSIIDAVILNVLPDEL